MVDDARTLRRRPPPPARAARGVLVLLVAAALAATACGEASLPEAPRPAGPALGLPAAGPPQTLRPADDPRLLPRLVRGGTTAARPAAAGDARYWSRNAAGALEELLGAAPATVTTRSARRGTAVRRVTVLDLGDPARAARAFTLVDAPLDASAGWSPSVVERGVRRFTPAGSGSVAAQLAVGGALVEVAASGPGAARAVAAMADAELDLAARP